MSLNKLWEIKKRIEQINQNSGEDVAGQFAGQNLKYEQRHRRITLYLENAVHADLQSIRNQGVSQSVLVNLAVKDFIARNWHESEHRDDSQHHITKETSLSAQPIKIEG